MANPTLVDAETQRVRSLLYRDLPIWRAIQDERAIDVALNRWELTLNPDYTRATGITAEQIRNFLLTIAVPLPSVPQNDEPDSPVIWVDLPGNWRNVTQYISDVYGQQRPGQTPRKLVPQEIVDLLNSVPFIMSCDSTRQTDQWLVQADDIDVIIKTLRPDVIDNHRTTSDTIRFSILKRLASQLLDAVLTPLGLDDLRQQIIQQFEKSRINPGSMVGVTAAEALGGPITQMALNSFHSSGSAKNVSYGIDAMRELLNVSQKRKHESCTIYFKNHELAFDDVQAKRNEIVEVTVANLIYNYDFGTPVGLGVEWWHQTYQLATGRTARNILHRELEQIPMVLRLYLDVNLLYDNRITMDQVVSAIETRNATAVFCIASPLALGIIDIYANEEKIREPLQKDKREIFNLDFAPFTFLNTIVYPNLSKISIKGISEIQRLFPADSSVWKIVREERLVHPLEKEVVKMLEDRDKRLARGETVEPLSIQQATQIERDRRTWYLILNLSLMRATGVTARKLQDLLEAASIEVLQSDPNLFIVYVPPNDLIAPLDVERRRQFPEEVQRCLVEEERETEITETNPVRREEVIRLRELERRKIQDSLYKPSVWINHRLAIDQREKKCIERYRQKTDRFFIRSPTPIERASVFYYAETDGSNLQALLGRDDVDDTRTLCNNVHEIYRVFGIEAARTFLIREFLAVIGHQGGDLNTRHVTLLVDFMTNMGEPTPITFSGISRQPIGALEKASFERAMDTFQEAAGFGKSETIKSVSAAVVIGQRAKIGTGYIDVLVDHELEEQLTAEMATINPPEIVERQPETDQAILDYDLKPATGSTYAGEVDPEVMGGVIFGNNELLPQLGADVNISTGRDANLPAPVGPEAIPTVLSAIRPTSAIEAILQRTSGVPAFKQIKEPLAASPTAVKQLPIPTLREGGTATGRIPLSLAPIGPSAVSPSGVSPSGVSPSAVSPSARPVTVPIGKPPASPSSIATPKLGGPSPINVPLPSLKPSAPLPSLKPSGIPLPSLKPIAPMNINPALAPGATMRPAIAAPLLPSPIKPGAPAIPVPVPAPVPVSVPVPVPVPVISGPTPLTGKLPSLKPFAPLLAPLPVFKGPPISKPPAR